MRNASKWFGGMVLPLLSVLAAACAAISACSEQHGSREGVRANNGAQDASSTCEDPSSSDTLATIARGREIFRFDTFGDEVFWGDALELHKAIEGAANGGVGDGVSPKTALAVGLKVDAEKIPAGLAAQIQAGQVNLDDPATTVALLDLGAVVGVKGIFDGSHALKSLGITCAFCHSTVDDSFSPGIGKRLDGWPNRDLDVGKIVSLAPDKSALVKALGVDEATINHVLLAWGPGKYDAELLLDGKGFRPDGKTSATLLPPAYGLMGVNLHTYTGWGSVPYWNAFVAITQMHGMGNFFDPRLDNAEKFPLAARNGYGHVKTENDLVTSKLDALHFYQLSLRAPKPAPGDTKAADRGKQIFEGKAKCGSCHVAPLYAEPGWHMHTGAEIGIDEFQAHRSPDDRYRTTPLRGLLAHSKGGFYHDGRFATLADVVDHYDRTFSLGLGVSEKAELVEFLKTL